MNNTRELPYAQTSLEPQDHNHSSHIHQQAFEDLYKLYQSSCQTPLDQERKRKLYEPLYGNMLKHIFSETHITIQSNKKKKKTTQICIFIQHAIDKKKCHTEEHLFFGCCQSHLMIVELSRERKRQSHPM